MSTRDPLPHSRDRLKVHQLVLRLVELTESKFKKVTRKCSSGVGRRERCARWVKGGRLY